MRNAAYDLTISAARADALSHCRCSALTSPARTGAPGHCGGVAAFGIRGCAARVAQAYGEHPETAEMQGCAGPARRSPARPAPSAPSRRSSPAPGGRTFLTARAA